MPYHEGAIRYFEEIGVWTEEMRAHSDELVRRQQVLADAWQALEADDLPDDQWEDAWNAARRAALTEAGFTPVF